MVEAGDLTFLIGVLGLSDETHRGVLATYSQEEYYEAFHSASRSSLFRGLPNGILGMM